jgi:hypothetical protein
MGSANPLFITHLLFIRPTIRQIRPIFVLSKNYCSLCSSNTFQLNFSKFHRIFSNFMKHNRFTFLQIFCSSRIFKHWARRARPRVPRQLPPERQLRARTRSCFRPSRSATPCGHAYHLRCVVCVVARGQGHVNALRRRSQRRGARILNHGPPRGRQPRAARFERTVQMSVPEPCFAVIIACRVVSCLSRTRVQKSSSTI